MSVLSRDAWVEAFHQQATNTLLTECRDQARWCFHEYRLDAAPGDDHDLVQKALTDIIAGRIEWNPSRRSLLDQMRDVIRYRVRNQKRSTSAHRCVSMAGDEESEGLHVELTTAASGEPADPEVQLRRKQERELGARIGAELAALVMDEKDHDAAAILACWWSGTSERKDILAETGMSAEVYRHARRRLIRLAGRLSNELRAKGKAQAE